MKIKALYIYPIKSLRGCSLDALPATYQGFAHDRRFMLLRAQDRKNMQVANFTEMCLFTTEIVFPTEDAGDGRIIVTFNPPTPNEFSPSHTEESSIEVPLQPDVSALGLSEEKMVMYSSPTVGFNMGEKYNSWFSERFGYDVILLYIGTNRREALGGMPPSAAGPILRERERAQQQQNGAVTKGESKREGGSGWLGSITSALPSIPFLSSTSTQEQTEYPGVYAGISFAEVAPYLVIQTKSWENAQRRLPEDEEMDITKFRPNIILEGAEQEFEEDFWGELEVFSSTPSLRQADGEKENVAPPPTTNGAAQVDNGKQEARKARLILTQNCARCNSLNIDYKTGKVGSGEAGKILKKLQSDRRVDDGSRYSPIFGRYGFLDRLDLARPEVEKGVGGMERVMLRVGDEVRVGRWNSVRTRWLWPNLGTT